MNDSHPDLETLLELLAALPDTVILIGEDRKLRFVSRLEAGYQGADVLGVDVSEFLSPEAREEHERELDRVFETAEPSEQLTELVGAHGQREWYEGRMIPLVREGRVHAVAIASRNVTARVQRDEELAMLRRLLPVCAWCKKVRDDDGEWRSLEAYLKESGKGDVTHAICPECEQSMSHEIDRKGA